MFKWINAHLTCCWSKIDKDLDDGSSHRALSWLACETSLETLVSWSPTISFHCTCDSPSATLSSSCWYYSVLLPLTGVLYFEFVVYYFPFVCDLMCVQVVYNLIHISVVYDLSKESNGLEHSSLTGHGGADFFAMEAFVNALWVGNLLCILWHALFFPSVISRLWALSSKSFWALCYSLHILKLYKETLWFISSYPYQNN